MKALFDIAADAFETVGVCLAVNAFGIVSNKLHNVPMKELGSWSYPNPAPSLPQQYSFS
jgi:peptide/nickel transport system substrate-binding protein